MRKTRMTATCVMLGAAMVLSSFTTAGATGLKPLDPDYFPVGTLLVLQNETEIKGKFTPDYVEKDTRIKVEKTSLITLTLDSSSQCKVKVEFKDENGVFKEMILPKGGTKSVYLLAGTYNMTISYYSSGFFTTPLTDNTFKLTYKEVPSRDTFEETIEEQDEMKEDANILPLGKKVNGCIAANETKVDTYEFHSHYSNVPVYISIKSEIKGDVGLCWSVYTPEALECLENNDYAGATISAGGFLTVADQYTYQWEGLDMDLPKGTYYLVLASPDDGYYEFELSQVPLGAREIKETLYTTVGSSEILNGESSMLQQYSLSWESLNPSVMNLNNTMFANVARAEKAGSTMVYGYGTKKVLINNRTSNVRVEIPVKVEFKDVIHKENPADNPYYYDPVYWAADMGITEGYKDNSGYYTTFKPQNKCTRSQILTFLWRMAGEPEPVNYTDYPDVKPTDYCYKAVSWAQEKGITEGYPDGTFRPGNVCSRAQIVTFLWRMADKPEPTKISNFKDNKDTKTYYYKAVNWAAEKGITEGYPDGSFKPMNECTRCQSVTFLYRYATGEN